MHPSESENYLLTRVIAYALNFESGLEFSPGLSSADEPAIQLKTEHGTIAKWIDIGNPSARRLHKASKAAQTVVVYTYKDPENLKREAARDPVYRADEILIYALDEKFLKRLAPHLGRDNRWAFIHNDGEISISVGQESLATTLSIHRLG